MGFDEIYNVLYDYMDAIEIKAKEYQIDERTKCGMISAAWGIKEAFRMIQRDMEKGNKNDCVALGADSFRIVYSGGHEMSIK